jgi:hypothetical protein
MTEDTHLRDIHSSKKLRKDVEGLKAFKKAMPFLRPILKAIKVDTNQMDKALAMIDEIAPNVEELTSLPDRFNDLLADRGWIIYESMNLEVAKAAIKKAEAGDFNGAETVLVDYYDAETVDRKLHEMNTVKAFHSRMPLARKALIDYSEGRYHACIPVVLALLDGMVNESHEKGLGLKKGFFAEGAKLEAWDSISAHSKGLKALKNILGRGRKKTTTEQITIPYRNGILHGMDLGYDNKMVAAKSWGALFAARVWAVKSEQGLLEPPPPEKPETWMDVLHRISENSRSRERWEAQLKNWHPRAIKPGQDIPSNGSPEAFEEGTPESKLAEFLFYWKAQNYGFMAGCLPSKPGYDIKALPARIRELYANMHLDSFEFIEINDVSPAVTEIKVKLIYDQYKAKVEKTAKFRMIIEDAEGNPSIHGTPGSNWVVYNWDIALFIRET